MENQKTVLLLVPDLLFGVRVANIVSGAGGTPRHSRSAAEFLQGLEGAAPAAAVVDLNNRFDTRPLIGAAAAAGVPVFAFGSHIDTEGILQARKAGARKVVANSAMANALPRWMASVLTGDTPEDEQDS